MAHTGDILNRTYDFGLRIIALARQLPDSTDCRVLIRQLVRSGTSIGANVEEATAGSSKEDSICKMNIALKEARETHYWLRLARDSKYITPKRFEAIIQEADELRRILGAIVSKSRSSRKQ
jgi:four helix bundle protein